MSESASRSESGNGNGRVEALWTKRAHRGPMDPTDRVRVVAGKGIESDANFGRSRRQVTIIEREVFDRIASALPGVDPAMRRANVMVSGIRLADSRDRILTIGAVRIRLLGETRPCERMDAQLAGLTGALDPDWNGGAHGVVLEGGEIAVGDAATLSGGGATA